MWALHKEQELVTVTEIIMTKAKLFLMLRVSALSGCLCMAIIMAIVGSRMSLNLSDYVFPTVVVLSLFVLYLLLIPFSKNTEMSSSSKWWPDQLSLMFGSHLFQLSFEVFHRLINFRRWGNIFVFRIKVKIAIYSSSCLLCITFPFICVG